MEQQIPSDGPIAPIVVLITTASPEERRAKCAWCWPRRNPGVPYPEKWSSTICPQCEAEMDAQHARLSAARAVQGGIRASGQEVRA
jgi:hypothetical protein